MIYRTFLLILSVLVVVFLLSSLFYPPKLAGAAWISLTFVALLLAYLVHHVRLWFAMTIAVAFSNLRLPGIGGQFTLFDILLIGFVPISVIYVFLQRSSQRSRRQNITRWIAVFAGVIIVTMIVRGAGFKIFGEQMWGGTFYIRLLGMMAFCSVASHFRFSARQWEQIVVILCALSLLPVASDLVYLKTDGNNSFQYIVGHSTTADLALSAENQGDRLVRIESAALAGVMLTILMLVVLRRRRRNNMLMALATLAIILFDGISGHRLSIIEILMLIMTWGYLSGLRINFWQIAGIGFALLFAISPLLMFAKDLPFSVQRGISWIPGLDISRSVSQNAESTVAWRLALWLIGLNMVPQYWLVGKGFAFAESVRSISNYATQFQWALVTTAFHNGPLSLLLGLGVLGLISGLGLLVFMARRHHRILMKSESAGPLVDYYRIVYAWFWVSVVIFIFIYGDVQVSFPVLLLQIAILESMQSNLRIRISDRSSLQKLGAERIQPEF